MILRLLIEKSNLNIKDENGFTPLHNIFNMDLHPYVTDLLVFKNVDIDIGDFKKIHNYD